MIHSEIDDLKKALLFHYFLPSLDKVKRHISERPFEELVYKMKSEADSRSFSEFIRILKLMTGES